MGKAVPLILTVALDEDSQHHFSSLRDEYFPKHCNYLQAHLTLFHHLPSDNVLIDEILQQSCKRPAMELNVTGIENIGNGCAFTIESEGLTAFHKTLQQQFSPFLISQDRNKIWPHITVQNKVTAFKAKQTTAILASVFEPFIAKGIGIDSWLYLNGPWEKKSTYSFE